MAPLGRKAAPTENPRRSDRKCLLDPEHRPFLASKASGQWPVITYHNCSLSDRSPPNKFQAGFASLSVRLIRQLPTPPITLLLSSLAVPLCHSKQNRSAEHKRNAASRPDKLIPMSTSAVNKQEEYVDVSTIGIDHVPPTPSPLPSSPDKATVSYWLATTPPNQLPTPNDVVPAHSDVVIIGSGITGVSCALHLISSLLTSTSTSTSISSITIVEARSFCSGATGRNGGHLTAASALAYTELSANPNHLLGASISKLAPDQIRTETAKAVRDILNFELDTANAIRAIIAEESAEEEVGFTDKKNWHLCFEQAEVDAFEDSLQQAREHEALRNLVAQVRRVPKAEVDERMNSPFGIEAVYEIPGATLHPRLLVSLIYKRAQRLAAQRGVELKLVTNTPVLKVTPPSSTFTSSTSVVSTAQGDIHARYVVHATNGYASHLLPHLACPTAGGIVPTRAQAVAVSPTSGKYLWGMSLSAGGGYEYGHQRPPSETPHPLYILGGGREYATGREWGVADDTSLNSQVSAFLHPYLAKTFPTSYGKDVEMEWTGIMGYTKSKDPLVGPVEGRENRREYIAAGYSGHGMTRAFGCAQVVADMILSDEKGESWRKRKGFPECYLTAKALAMLAADAGTQVAPTAPETGKDGVAALETTGAKIAVKAGEDEPDSSKDQPSAGSSASRCLID